MSAAVRRLVRTPMRVMATVAPASRNPTMGQANASKHQSPVGPTKAPMNLFVAGNGVSIADVMPDRTNGQRKAGFAPAVRSK